MNKHFIEISAPYGGFAEDKDDARKIRQEQILPFLKQNIDIAIDFKNVSNTTQSYIHALVGEALNQYGEDALDHIEFMNCSPLIQNIIGLVVNYSLGGFPLDKLT